MYICKYEILAHFNLAVAKVDRQTAKFNSRQIFRLYGIYILTTFYHNYVPFTMSATGDVVKFIANLRSMIASVQLIATER